LARWLRKWRKHARVEAVPLKALCLDGADILINATTVGMRPADGSLVDPAMLRRGLIVYDLVYHRRTALVREAARRGCVAAGGSSMLLYQGAASFEAWFGIEAPVAVMRRALTEALKNNGRMRADRKLSGAKRPR
jgi:shikimate dehydrogenase